jgi:type II secretory pathway pseudopilin PulG
MRRRGFMMADAIAGLVLLGTLATLLAVAAGMRQKSAQRLSVQRHAQVLAQEALANLQATGTPKVSDDLAHVSVERTGKFVADREWVEVTVTSDGRRSSIVGLAPTTQPEASR